MVAILKILKTKSTTLSDDLFLCQVLKRSAVGSEFNIVCTLVTMATAANLNFFQPAKSCHTIWWIFLQSFMKFDERNPFFFKSPFFVPWQLQQSLSNRFRFFWLITFHQMWMLFLSSFINFCLASNLLWSFLCFSIFLHFGHFHGNGSHFEKNQPVKAQLHMAYDIPTRFHKV